jgi:hypothetical protein
MPKVYFGRKDEPGFDLEISDDIAAKERHVGAISATPVSSKSAERL